MKTYVLRRLFQLLPILLAITFLSFGMMRIAGSDVVEQKMENTGSDISQEVVDAAREELGLDQAISDTVCGLAWRNPARRHGNQLCIRQTSVLYVYLQVTGNIAFDSYIYSVDDPYIYSAGNPGSSLSESCFGLSYTDV